MKFKKRVIVLLLVIVMCVPVFTISAQARASLYLSYYITSIGSNGNGSVTVYFDVVGTGKMDEIGALTILIKDSTGAVKQTYKYATTTGMLTYNTSSFGSSVTYAGTPGVTYYAVVTVWAGKGGLGDSRDVTTSSVKA